MSNPVNLASPAGFDSFGVTLIAADGTNARMLCQPSPEAAGSSLAATKYGGSSILDLTAVSSTTERDVRLYRGRVRSTVPAGPEVFSTTSGSINRTVGSYIADGWRAGMHVMCFAGEGAAPQAVEGVLAIVTAVSATSLVLSGTPLSALTLEAGCRICQVTPLLVRRITASAGNNAISANQQVLFDAPNRSILKTELKLGAQEFLAVAALTAVGALPEALHFNGQRGVY